MKRLAHTALLAALCAWSAEPSMAGTITLTGTDGGARAASATFTDLGGQLLVSLSNLGTDVVQPDQVLTAIFFNLAGNPTLGRVSAVVPAGSSVLFGSTGPGGVVGGEWAYATGLSGLPLGATQGIGSSGFGLFSPGQRFPGSNLQGPLSVNGLEYGITSAVDNPLSGDAPVTGSQALIRNTVLFTLSGLPAGFDAAAAGAITNLSFQYGTSLAEPNVPDPPGLLIGVSEPKTLALLTMMLGGLLAWRRYATQRVSRMDSRSRVVGAAGIEPATPAV